MSEETGVEVIHAPPHLMGKACAKDLMGDWLMEPSAFTERLEYIKMLGPDKVAEMAVGFEPTPIDEKSSNVQGTQVVPVHGSITKTHTSLSAMFGGTSSLEVRNYLKRLEANEEVDSVLLHIFSSGGTFQGLVDFADAVRDFDKPIHAFAEDQATSAAFWLLTQADYVTANRAALLGSVGTRFGPIVNDAEALKEEGKQAIVLVTGERKADFAPHVPITDGAIAAHTDRIETMTDMFVDAIATARGVSEQHVRSVAGDANIFFADQALSFGFIDRVTGTDDEGPTAFDQAVMLTREHAKSGSPPASNVPDELSTGTPSTSEDEASTDQPTTPTVELTRRGQALRLVENLADVGHLLDPDTLTRCIEAAQSVLSEEPEMDESVLNSVDLSPQHTSKHPETSSDQTGTGASMTQEPDDENKNVTDPDPEELDEAPTEPVDLASINEKLDALKEQVGDGNQVGDEPDEGAPDPGTEPTQDEPDADPSEVAELKQELSQVKDMLQQQSEAVGTLISVEKNRLQQEQLQAEKNKENLKTRAMKELDVDKEVVEQLDIESEDDLAALKRLARDSQAVANPFRGTAFDDPSKEPETMSEDKEEYLRWRQEEKEKVFTMPGERGQNTGVSSDGEVDYGEEAW